MKIKLIENQKNRLKNIQKEKISPKLWNRVRAILLLNGGEKIKNIAQLLGVHRNTIGNWIKDWNREERVHQRDGRGSKPKLTKEMKEDLELYFKGENATVLKAKKLIEEKYNLQLSRDTIRRFVKKNLDIKE